jgi:cellulose synthase/poly-beta-1,6-N-acetylglucosamine synthase-like glycosyltransferase
METFIAILHAAFDVVLAVTFLLSAGYFLVTLFVFVRPQRRASEAAASWSDEALPGVTVQIPTYNEPAALNCARCCLDFEYPPEKLQILIGDDSSDPAVSERIDRFAATHPQVEVCRRGGNAGFKPGNLNAMLPASRGDYLLILDSDFLPPPDFLRRLTEPVLRDPSLDGVQAAWKIINVHDNLSTLMGSGIISVIHSVMLPFIKTVTGTGVFCGSGELVKKSCLTARGGWTEGALTEDVDYSLRLIAEGGRIEYLERLTVPCEVPYTPGDLFRQQMRWAYGVMRAFMLHGRRLLIARAVRKRTKFAALCFGSGYLMILLLLLTAGLGAMNLVSGFWAADLPAAAAPGGPLAQTARNVLLTGGMLISSVAAGFIQGFGVRGLLRLVFSSLTLGVLCMFFVGRGILRAWLGLPMKWFMLRKAGNEQAVEAGV